MSKEENKQASKADITIPVRFFFAAVFQPTQGPKQPKPKYSVSAAWPKTDTATTAMVKAAYAAACESEGAKKKWAGQPTTGSIRDVINDGDKKKANRPEYKGMYYVSAKSDNKPTVSKIQNGKRVEVFDDSEFYSGCFGYLACNLYAFNESGSRSIAVGLNHVLKTKDGEKLTGRTQTAEDAFSNIPGVSDDGLDDLDDLDDDDLG